MQNASRTTLFSGTIYENLILADNRALVTLKTPYLERDAVRHKLSPGMQVTAEINLGSRTVLEYLLSSVQKTVHEAGRER